jgi:hypothetical protein
MIPKPRQGRQNPAAPYPFPCVNSRRDAGSRRHAQTRLAADEGYGVSLAPESTPYLRGGVAHVDGKGSASSRLSASLLVSSNTARPMTPTFRDVPWRCSL